MTTTRSHYPLQWPEGWRRTRPIDRRRSRFDQPSAYAAAKALIAELGRMGAIRVVITSFLPVRSDGLPYSDDRSEDPGIAVWFDMPDQVGTMHERVFACDKWTRPSDNLHAIALSVEAMRGLERWGMADVIGRVVAGFAALPAAQTTRTWREIFEIDFAQMKALPPEDLLVVVRNRHRKAIATAHPDKGGDPQAAASLNEAMQAAEAELTGEIHLRATGELCVYGDDGRCKDCRRHHTAWSAS